MTFLCALIRDIKYFEVLLSPCDKEWDAFYDMELKI